MPTKKSSIYVWAGRLIFARRSLDTDFHCHHAAAVAIALDNPFVVEADKGRKERLYSTIIPPDTYHRTLATDADMIVLLVDPESSAYESFVQAHPSGAIEALDHSIFNSLRNKLPELFQGLACRDAWGISQDILGIISRGITEKPAVKSDKRVEKIAEKLRRELPERIRIKDLEKEISISGDRLMRLFKQQTGLPLRRYLLWARILKSATLLRQGLTLTEAAHEAGFSDSAHMSRTFKKNFGFSPSFFFGKNDAVQFHFCDETFWAKPSQMPT